MSDQKAVFGFHGNLASADMAVFVRAHARGGMSMVVIRKKHKETAEEKEARLKAEEAQAQGIQDQYQARGFELVSWVQDHKVFVSTLIAVLILAGAGLSGFLYYQKRSAEIASGAYLEALKPIESMEEKGEEAKAKLQKAENELMEIAKSQGSSGIGVLANIYGGHIALENDDQANAVALYQTALKHLNKSDVLYPLALTGLGYAQEENGDVKSAFSTFESLVELRTNPSKDLALFEAARLASLLKDSEQAKKNLARLLEEYPSSVYEKDAERLKESIK